VSTIDLQHLQSAAAHAVRATVVVPGVDCDALQPLVRRPSGSNLVFVGSMNYIPNVDAAEFFVNDVLPLIARERPDVTFTIVGARPSAAVRRLAEDPRVSVTGPVDDVRPYYAAAAAAVVPLRAGGGVRMKILEGMALGVPMVSTTIGAEGLSLEHGRELLIGDTPQELADAAIGLLRDPALGDRLARAARETALRRFSWESVAAVLDGVYNSVVGRYSANVPRLT
jgi:glycosyltransferase involved in cell wall biosynthesis